jgi:HD-GYP domain-containing protein (c-di-GMP phosphodiesterase class II)
LWNGDGSLIAATDGAAEPEPVAASVAADGAREFKTGDVLASFTRLNAGTVVEIRQDYGPIAHDIAGDRRFALIVIIAACAALFALFQAIAWAATRGLRGEYRRLLRLYRTGEAVRSTLDIGDVLERLLRDGTEYARAGVGLVFLVDEQSKDLILTASYDRDADTCRLFHRQVDEWFLRRVVATGEHVITHQDRPPFDPVFAAELAPQGPISIAVVPIHGRETVAGVLAVMRPRFQGEFVQSDTQMLGEMAGQASMAVQQAQLFGKIRGYADEVELGYDSTLKVLMAALDTKDAVTQGHSERVSQLTVALAKEMGVPQDQLVNIERGALLHDVGKIGVPDHVLRKPDSLNAEEWEAMRQHPVLAGLMVSKVAFLEGALPILLYHHEHYDGTGYPFALEQDAIPLEARIFTVVDSFDAMTSDRPYRDAMPIEDALEEIKRNAGTQFDPQVVEAFTRLINRRQQAARTASEQHNASPPDPAPTPDTTSDTEAA